jgi:hypothetical protein
MAAEPPRSSRLQPLATGLKARLLRRFAEISTAAKLGKPSETATAKQGAVAVSMDVSDGSDVAIEGGDSVVPDKEEIERRRILVRTLFNDFGAGLTRSQRRSWSALTKPKIM